MATYSAGSASVQIVPDFSNAQRKIGQWFAQQGDLKVNVQPDLDNLAMARIHAQVEAQRPEMKVGIDRAHFAKQVVEAVDFLTGTSTIGNALRRLFDVKPILMANLGGAGVAIASSIGQSLTAAVGGAAAMFPSLISAAAIPIGTAVLGSQGIGDAFKALGGTTQEDAKKLAAAMKDLAPSARNFVTQVHALAPAFKDLRLDVQQHLFNGLGESVNKLGRQMLPMLKEALGPVADEIGGIGKNLIGALSTNGNVNDFAETIDNVAQALHNVGQAVAPLWQAFADLATVGSGFLPDLTKGFGELAQRFADFIRAARDSGALKQFISTAFDGLKQVWGIVTDLGGVLKSVFSAALPSGQELLKILKLVTGDLNAFFKTDAAKSGLTTFFEGLTTAIGNITPGLTSLVEAMVTAVLPAMAGLAQAVAPLVNTVLVQFADLLTTLGPLFYPALAGAISTALGALAPLMDVFADLAKTVLPVVIDAITELAPLFVELAEGVGEALTRAIDTLAPALPPIVDAFHAIAEALVPFALQALNIAVDILPPFVAILQGLAKVLEFIAPILPAVVTGFLALKAVGLLTGMFTGLSTQLLNAAVGAERLGATKLSNGLFGMAGGAERASGALKGMGTALGIAGVFMGLFMAAMDEADQKTTEWAQGLMKGGQAARDAAEEMKKAEGVVKATSGWRGFFNNFMVGGSAINMVGQELGTTAEKAHELWAAMSPLEQAQSKQAYWATELAYRQKDGNATAAEVEAAKRRLAYWSEQVSSREQAQADATKTATDRLKEQQDAILEAANAQLAFENSQVRSNDAMERYNQVMADGTASQHDRRQAELDVRASIADTADAAKRLAEANAAGKTSNEIAKAGADAYLSTMKDLASHLTGPARVALDGIIAGLEKTSTSAQFAKTDAEKLGLSVLGLPTDKTIQISTPTKEQEAQLAALGYHVEHMPNGTVYVTANTSDADAKLNAWINQKRTLGVTVVATTSGVHISGPGGSGNILKADGGIVRAFRDGGFMQGGIAQVVKPNTWRVIGDRVRDDEAYIPINSDRRSQEILSVTAERMGFDLVKNALGSYVMPPGMGSVYGGADDVAALTAQRDASSRRTVVASGASTAASVAGFVNNGTVVTTDLDELARKSRRGTQRALAVAGL